MPGDLETVTAQELLERPLEGISWLIEGLLAVGLIVLAGTPKVGKSWFAALLGLCVSTGQPFLEHATAQAEVLYLCLEDTFPRIQQRLFHLTDAANEKLHFAVMADKLQNGLVGQLERFVAQHPDTKLVIVDTLQTVRNATNDNAYAADYGDLGMLKRFADEHGLAVLLIHHTRKMSDSSNVFNMVSGSNGIMGSADETMILAKGNFFDGKATLSVTGRDVDLAEYKLAFRDCRWELIEQTSRDELEERDVPAAVLTVLDFMSNRAGNWEGTATQLIDEAGVTDVKSNVLAKFLNEHSAFLHERGTKYDYRRTSTARLITLTKIVGADSQPVLEV
ncbi:MULTISPECIES: AAA family ATPase [Eggerthella]|uniref:AAA family ATPase n=1 Tax=Eggerthella TaxID=84111 RepID=UPI00189B483D|nr:MULTISPECIES: AAA family ATPase [Eggerthella]MCB5390652.1 helicase RepA family protein [Eggerthella lenta]